MAELATATGATILLTHHMRKDGMLRIADGDDAREAIRGTTALVDGARLGYALWKLDEAARPICNTLQIPFERGRIVRGAVVKANDEADHDAHTYTREESGLLVQIEAEPDGGTPEQTLSIAQAREVLKEIDRRFNEGKLDLPCKSGEPSPMKDRGGGYEREQAKAFHGRVQTRGGATDDDQRAQR